MTAIGNRVARVDRWKVRMDANLNTDERGFAKIWGTVITARAVMEYGPLDGHPDGHLEFVPESTVFDASAMSSLMNAPVTFLHPAEPVTADNSVRVTVGHIIDVKRDGDRLRALHQIEDAQAIAKIRGGVVELSPGYTTQLDDPDGLVIDGKRISAIQRDRVYNHQAIVPEARAGHDNALTIDARILPADGLRIQKPGATMANYVFDGKTVEVDADLLAHIQKLSSTGDADKGDAEEEEEKENPFEDGKKGDDDDEKGDADADKPADASDDAKGEPPSASNDAAPQLDAKSFAAEVTKIVLGDVKRDRAAHSRSGSIVTDARGVLPQSYGFEGKTDADVMLAAIKERDPDLATRAKGMRGDALYGFFQATIATRTPGRSDSKSVIRTKNTYADALEFRSQRIDAVAGSEATGDSAVRCPAALKLVFGGKA